MNHEDRKAIEDLFGKLASVEHQSGPRDAEAEAYIRERVGSQPGSPYYMAQTIVVQEQALAAANARIAQLERQPAAHEEPRRGGLFGGLFGGGANSDARNDPRSEPRNDRAPGRPSPWGAAAGQPAAPARGGGFLAGAAQTAVGVAGGMMLGSALSGMFGGDEAQAATPDDAAAPEATDTGDAGDEGGFFDGFGEDW